MFHFTLGRTWSVLFLRVTLYLETMHRMWSVLFLRMLVIMGRMWSVPFLKMRLYLETGPDRQTGPDRPCHVLFHTMRLQRDTGQDMVCPVPENGTIGRDIDSM